MKKQFEKRRYQQKTVENFCTWYNAESKLSTIILATGLGKSHTTSSALQEIPNQKILWVAHREELINQAYESIKNVVTWTDKISVDLADKKADPNSDIIVASVQTLAGKRENI